MTPVRVRRAGKDDIVVITRLLEAASLASDDIDRVFREFLVAENGDHCAGTVGLEPYGTDGLLRSLAVDERFRSQGIGEALIQAACSMARAEGISRLVLLTTTAPEYFSRHGFRTISRGSVTGSVAASSQFRGACPASAICMERILP